MILCLVIENAINFTQSFRELTRKTFFSFLFSCSGFSLNNRNIKAVCRIRYSNCSFLNRNGISPRFSELQIIKKWESGEKKNKKGTNLIIKYVYYQKYNKQSYWNNGIIAHACKHLPRSTFITIYKSFIRAYFDYWDFIYDQAYSNFFHQMLETTQCTFALAIKGTFLCL